jgi:hypothetical protein
VIHQVSRSRYSEDNRNTAFPRHLELEAEKLRKTPKLKI